MTTRAPLVEVFASIQGEGRFVGRPMAFVRVAVCPLRCTYCDTPESYTATAEFPVRLGAPSGENNEERHEQNPVDGQRAAELALTAMERSPFCGHGRLPPMVSVTGGEPLLYPGFVRAVGEELHDAGVELLLETAALDARALADCVAAVDHVSADYKLPETLEGSEAERDLGEQHVGCVQVAVEARKSVDLKIVLTSGVQDASLATALDRLRPWREDVQLILQPVTPFGQETRPLPAERLLDLARLAVAAGFTPRVIPQVHKVLQLP